MLFKKRKYKKLKERVESILVNYPEIFKYFFSEFELYHAKLKYFKNPEGKYSTNPHPHDPIIDAQRNDFDNFLYGYIGTEVSKKADDRHQELIEINKPILDIRWEIYDLKKKGVHYYDDTEPKTNIYLNFLEYTSIFAWKLNGILEEIENYDKETKELNEDYLESDFSESKNPEAIELGSNKELRLILSGIDKDEINSFSVDILYDKWTFFEEINYKGTFKGFDFILKGGSAIKWSKHKGCYKDDIDAFLNDINSKEISELDFQSLNYECEDSDEDYDYNFFKKIIWNKNTPKEIIKEVKENYSDNEFEKLRDEIELEEDFLDIELFQYKGLINQLSISISYKNNKVKYLSWIKEESHSNIIDKDKIGERFLDFQDVRKLIAQLKENKIPIKFRSIWENYFYYQLKDESQKGFASESDHWDILNEYLDTYGIKKDYDKEKQLHYNYITYIEEKKIDYDQFIEESAIEDYIDACEKQDKDEYKGWVQLDFSYDDYLSWTVEEDFFNDPAVPGWLNSNNRDLIAPLNQANEEIKLEFSLDYKCFDDVIDFNFSEVNFKSQDHLYVFDDKLLVNDNPRNEKDLIQELGRIHNILDLEEYKKEAYNLWRDFFLLKYDEDEEENGVEIGQEANNKMFDKYEVNYVNFFINYIDDGDTNSLGVRFPFRYLENGKPALIYNFPFKYDQITAHSSGSFYQLDKVWGSLNEVCKSLSEIEIIDFNKLSQNKKIQLFKPNRDDYS